MKKILLLFIAAFAVCTAKADGVTSSQVPDEGLPGIVNTLSKVEGYVFITLGEERNLRKTFMRTDEVFQGATENKLINMTWEVYNPGVASVDHDDGILTGESYGNTLMRVYNNDEEHWYIVFVCPTITVLSPEGSIYVHQKIFNEKAKVKLSQSSDYVINTVMRRDLRRAEADDITDNIVMHESTDDGHGYGEYISDDDIKDDVTLTITLESRRTNNLGQPERSGLRVRVDGMKVSVVTADKGEPVGGLRATIKSVNGQVVYSEKMPADGVINFADDVTGVYFMSFDDFPDFGTFKFLTR